MYTVYKIFCQENVFEKLSYAHELFRIRRGNTVRLDEEEHEGSQFLRSKEGESPKNRHGATIK